MSIRNNFKNQIIALFFISSIALAATSCKKDNLDETNLDAPTEAVMSDSVAQGDTASAVQDTTPSIDVKSEGLVADGIISTSYYLVKSLPSGYVKDGSKDYTSYVQAAITKYSNVVFPAFPIMVNDNGINIGSNKVITFPAGSQIKLKASSKGTYAIFKMNRSSNVTLYNPVIIGDRNNHIGTSGEWGMGIALYGATNIKIYGANISNCWGDGIYLGQASSTYNCKTIVIKDAVLKKNRRDGISIIAVDGLQLDNLYAGYTDGTSPMAGINIEPNNTASQVKNVAINNPRTEKNGKMGIQINLSRMIGSTAKTSNITITNHNDTGSPRYAFKLNVKNTSYPGKLSGSIVVSNPTWSKTSLETGVPHWLGSNHPNYAINYSSPSWTTTSGSLLSWTNTYNLLMKYKSGTNLKVVQ